MDRKEALTILRERMAWLRTRSYDELLQCLGNPISVEVVGPSGQEYQIEIEAMWDAEPKTDLRVFASIDDGSLRWATAPLSETFIILPDGSFVGE